MAQPREKWNGCRQLCLEFALVGSLFFIVSCRGGGSGSSQPTSPPSSSIASVSVSPSSATVAINGTQQFTATVMGTGAFNSAVTWSVNGVFGGTPGGGMINASGIYTAPSFAPTPNTVTISATSVQDTTKSGMAQSTATG